MHLAIQLNPGLTIYFVWTSQIPYLTSTGWNIAEKPWFDIISSPVNLLHWLTQLFICFIGYLLPVIVTCIMLTGIHFSRIIKTANYFCRYLEACLIIVLGYEFKYIDAYIFSHYSENDGFIRCFSLQKFSEWSSIVGWCSSSSLVRITWYTLCL